MSIDIRPIRIMLDTNIPGKAPVPFTKSLLYNPVLKNMADLDEYPSFTMDAVFPDSYLQKLSYENRIRFFFSKAQMMKVFKIQKPDLFKSSLTVSSENPEILTQKEKEAAEKEQMGVNEKKQELIKIKEELKTKTKDEVVKSAELTKAQSDKAAEIAKLTAEENKKIAEFKQYLQDLAPATIQAKQNEIYDPAKNLNDMLTKETVKGSFTKQTNKNTLLVKEITPYMKDLLDKIQKLYDYFNSYLSDEFIAVDQFLKSVNKSWTDLIKSSQGIGAKLTKSYKMMNTLKDTPILNNFYRELTDEFIANKVKDKERGARDKAIQENDKKIKPIEDEVNTIRMRIEELRKKQAELEGSVENPKYKIVVDNKKERMLNQAKNIDENIIIMLRLLFPTRYPFAGNISSSYNTIILKQIGFNLTMYDFLPPFLRKSLVQGTSLYSYVKIDGKVYTVLQVVWLNDIYNHKEYADLIDKFKKLTIWKERSAAKLNELLETKKDRFNANYKSGFDKSDLDYIASQKKDPSKIPVNQSSAARSRLETEYFTYNSAVDDFIATINAFQTSVINNETDAISDNAKNMVETYRTVTKFGANFFKPKEKFNKIIDNVSRELEDIRVNEYIRDKYLAKPGIDLDYERDEPKYLEKLKSNFKEYTDFAENIKKFRLPNKESSNYYLQKTFNEFLEGREQYKGIFNFLMNPYNIHINPFDRINKQEMGSNKESFIESKNNYHLRKNTGVMLLPNSGNDNEPSYEIYVQLNVIGGEYNDENISKINCMFQDLSLGQKLEYQVNESLRNPWDINSMRVFFDEEDVKQRNNEKQTQDKLPQKTEPIKKEEQPPPQQKITGGKMNFTRKLREEFIRNFSSTRKHY